MKKLKVVTVHLLLMSILILTGCQRGGDANNGQTKKTDIEVIRVGSILPLTGPVSVYGEYAKSGHLKALEKINTQLKNKKIEIVFEDGKGIPKESINAYRKLRSEGIEIFITTLSPICLSIMPEAIKDSVLLFADAAHPKITEDRNPLVFRHSNTSSQEALLIAEHIIKSSFQDIVIAYVNDDYGLVTSQGLAGDLKNKVKDLVVLPFDKTQSDFSVLVQKIKAEQPDVTVIIGAGQNMGALIKKIGDMKIKTTIIANIGYIITGADKLVDDPGIEIQYVNFDFEQNDDIGESVSPLESLEYGTMLLLGKAIAEAGSKPSHISNYILTLKAFNSGVEKMTINDNGDIIPQLKIENAQ